MNHALIEQRPCLPATELELAQLKTLLLLHDRHRVTVKRMLALREISDLEELDGISLRNLLHYLLST